MDIKISLSRIKVELVKVLLYLFIEHIFEPQDFLWHEGKDINKSIWIFPVKSDVTEEDTSPYKIIEFPGSIFLVATGDENDIADLEETVG